MHLRNQNKPPMISGYDPSRSPSNLDKRRKIGGGKMVGSARPPLSAINAVPGSNGAVPSSESSNGDSTGGQFEFKSREDVVKLLAEKSDPKNKKDFKGRNEEKNDYIKRLKTCINWFMELEDGYIAEQQKICGILESEQLRHRDIETHMSCKIDELILKNEEHQRQMVSLEESLRKEEAAKLAAIKSCEQEAEAKIILGHEMIQRLEEYNRSLLQYNNNLLDDVVKNRDTITKLQEDKAVMVECLTRLRPSLQEAINERDKLKGKVDCLKSKLEKMKVDSDHQLEQVQSMTAELKKYEELNGKSCRDLDNALTKDAALEKTCSSRQDQIIFLDNQLATANVKFEDVHEQTTQDQEGRELSHIWNAQDLKMYFP